MQWNPIHTLASYNRLQALIILQECVESKMGPFFSVWIIHVYENQKNDSDFIYIHLMNFDGLWSE